MNLSSARRSLARSVRQTHRALSNGNPLDRTIPRLLEVHSRRTRRVVPVFPGPDRMEPASCKFTFGDLVRHLATIERYMYAETWRTPEPLRWMCRTSGGLRGGGCFLGSPGGRIAGDFRTLTDADLERKCLTPPGLRSPPGSGCGHGRARSAPPRPDLLMLAF